MCSISCCQSLGFSLPQPQNQPHSQPWPQQGCPELSIRRAGDLCSHFESTSSSPGMPGLCCRLLSPLQPVCSLGAGAGLWGVWGCPAPHHQCPGRNWGGKRKCAAQGHTTRSLVVTLPMGPLPIPPSLPLWMMGCILHLFLYLWAGVNQC